MNSFYIMKVIDNDALPFRQRHIMLPDLTPKLMVHWRSFASSHGFEIYWFTNPQNALSWAMKEILIERGYSPRDCRDISQEFHDMLAEMFAHMDGQFLDSEYVFDLFIKEYKEEHS